MAPKLTHEQCREQMCAACGGRAGKRKVTPHIGEMIKRWAQPMWNPNVASFPIGICDSCRTLLTQCEKLQTTDLPGKSGTKQRWLNFKLRKYFIATRSVSW